MKKPKPFDAYAVGLCEASVCSSLGKAETRARLNRQRPTGIKSRWRLAKESFATGEPNPHPCENFPETHNHYLFDC